MTKISSKSVYTIKNPIKSDYFVGSNSENFGQTVNFGFEETAKLVNSLNGTSIVNYLYDTSPYIPTEVLVDGKFLSFASQTSTSLLTKLYVNKFNHSGDNLSELYLFLKANATDFYLKLRDSNNQNNTVYFDIASIEDFSDYFIFNIAVFKENEFLSTLVNQTVYFFDFELKATTSAASDPLKLDKSTYTGDAKNLDDRIIALEGQAPGDYVKIVYVNTVSPNTAIIFSEITPPVINNNSLKQDSDNLYIGNDVSTWVWNGSTYITKVVPYTSNFNIYGTFTDAGNNKDADIYRNGAIYTNKFYATNIGFISKFAASNSVSLGSYLRLINSAQTDGNQFQLNASNGVDLWNLNNGTWNKIFTFSSSGEFTANSVLIPNATTPNQAVNKSQLDLKVDKVTGKGLSTEDYTTSEKNKLASIDATHYLAPLQTTVQLSALPQAGISDKARVYVENDLSDYFYDATAASGDIAPDDQAGGIGFWRKVAVGGETAASIKTKYESNADTNAFTDALKAKLDSITAIFTTALKSSYDGVVTGYNALMLTGSRLITTGEITKLSSTSNTNSGDETTATIKTKLGITTLSGSNTGDETTTTLKSKIDVELAYACSDETSNLTVGNRVSFRVPFAMTLSEIRISVNDAPTVSSLVVDVKEAGISIFSTLLSIDASQLTSVTSATPAVISDVNLADDALITVSTTQIGSENAGKGLKILFKGKKA